MAIGYRGLEKNGNERGDEQNGRNVSDREEKKEKKKIEEERRREGRIRHSGDLTLRFSAFCDTEKKIE